jgi:hypothetical protein
MAFYDNYRYEDYRMSFDVPDGDHLVTISKAAPAITKNGREMIEVTLKVDGTNVPYTERFVDNEYANKNLSRFFDSFCIQPGNFNFSFWAGKNAYAHFEHGQETFTGNDGVQKTVNKSKLKYFIVPEKPSMSDFPEDIPYSTPKAPAAPVMKGGPATAEEQKRITELLGAKYSNGNGAVFSPEEKQQYATYRKDMTAAELIVFIEKALKNRDPLAPEINGGQTAIF